MRKLSAILAGCLLFAAASAAQAQSTGPSPVAADSTAKAATQPSPQEALDNLQKAAEDLSKAVEVAVAKIANSPEIRTTALQIAAGAVTVAQQSLAEQLKTIEAALNAAARQIAAAQAANSAKSQTPTK